VDSNILLRFSFHHDSILIFLDFISINLS
jgi:hypothetical protein